MAREIKKRVKNAILYADGTIKVENVRASYPHLFTPQEGDNGDKSYSCSGLMPKATHKEAKELIKEAILAVQAENKKLGTASKDMWFLKDGDSSGKEAEKGMFKINAREKKKPSVRDKDKTPLSKDDADKIEGGVLINMFIRPWFQKNKFGTRINANLISVQLVKDDGTRYGEGRISEDEIDEVWDEIDDDDGGFDDDDDMDGL
jgi:hypothetical protein